MSRRSSIPTLPRPVLYQLTAKIKASHYGQSEAIALWLKEQGFHISKSTIHRYAQILKKHDGYTTRSGTLALEAEIFNRSEQ